jgi:hypothetical protein
MTDRLSDLLAQRARQGSAVHPSREGVEAAISRRATRRKRQRAIGTGLASLCLAAGTVGGFAIASNDDARNTNATTDPPAVGDLPLVGIDLPGYLRSPGEDPDPTEVTSDITYAVFTGDAGDPLGPLVTAASHAGVGQPDGSPVDLDGDGTTGDEGDANLITFPGGAAVVWAEDGQVMAIDGHGVSSDDVIAYASQVRDLPFDLEAIPTPEGLPHREVVTFGPVPDFASRVATYQGPGTQQLQVLTTDEPGYFDLTRIVSTEGVPYEEVPLGPSFLGSGVALVSADDDGPTAALIRTDDGLIVHITADGLDAPVLRTAIETGHLVDLEPAPSPTTTSTVAPQTTGPATTTSIVGGDDEVGDITVGPNRIVIETTALGTGLMEDVRLADATDPRCEAVDASIGDRSPFEMFDDLRADEDDTREVAGWVNVTFREPQTGYLPGPVLGPDGDVFLACAPDNGVRVLSFPLLDSPTGGQPEGIGWGGEESPTRIVISLDY